MIRMLVFVLIRYKVLQCSGAVFESKMVRSAQVLRDESL